MEKVMVVFHVIHESGDDVAAVVDIASHQSYAGVICFQHAILTPCISTVLKVGVFRVLEIVWLQ